MSDEKRTYRMQRRAESQQRTRQRITESAVALHTTLGPSRTTMSAVAEHAGVRRSTLYRHFADDVALLDACTAHWSERNPFPDVEAWLAIREPGERLERALGELYGYYRRNQELLANLFRDESTMPAVRERFAAFHAAVAGAREALAGGRARGRAARRRVSAALGVATAFATWRSLAIDDGLSDAEAVALMRALVDAAGERRPDPGGARRPRR